jgi:hypothetical protein
MLRARGEKFGIVILATAGFLYAVAETWRHAITILAEGDSLTCLDDIEKLDQRFSSVNVDYGECLRSMECISLLVYRKNYLS